MTATMDLKIQALTQAVKAGTLERAMEAPTRLKGDTREAGEQSRSLSDKAGLKTGSRYSGDGSAGDGNGGSGPEKVAEVWDDAGLSNEVTH
jgi:hypothetical protein